LKEKEESTHLVPLDKSGKNNQLQKLQEKIIEVNGERMTPDMLRELISKNPDRVCSALRSWTMSK
jgi:hypothetical protein